MYVKSLKTANFRNIENASLTFCDRVNVIFGNNAQGKTNLIEAIYFCGGLGSFRGAKENELLKLGREFFSVECDFFSFGRDKKISIKSGQSKRKISVSNVPLKSYSELCEHFKCVVFFPDDLSLIKRSPENRRKFLDNALCTLKPGYKNLLLKYRRALLQKNSLLKDYYKFDKGSAEAMLDGFDGFIARYGSAIANQRSIYVERLQKFADTFFSGLSDGAEKLELSYSGSDLCGKGGEQRLYGKILEKREQDIKNVSTSEGPHRHDLEIKINGLFAREYGSQGQQRSAAIALKLSEAALLNEYTGERPVIILDDVMSELDSRRQQYILNEMGEGQTFITCCDPGQIKGLCGGKAILARDGQFFESELNR